MLASGGVRIIGSERHESRRIDNQLRGRAGRQGDAGSSRFYLSLDDHLMRIFASPRVVGMMRRLGMEPGEPIEHSLVTKAIENAQRKLEGHHFDIRKQLLEYDNVANNQRKVIYNQRAVIMEMPDPREVVDSMREDVISDLVDSFIPPQSLEDQWDLDGLTRTLSEDFQIKTNVREWVDQDHSLQADQIKEKIEQLCIERYNAKEAQAGREVMAQFEKSVILQTLDLQWREHLASMDYLRQGIHLRGYAQKDPKQEYKREAFELFTTMLTSMKYEIVRLLTAVEIQTEADLNAVEDQRRAEQIKSMQFLHPIDNSDDVQSDEFADTTQPVQTIRRTSQKVGRNDNCPCGSGKKFKHCHGTIA